MEDILASHDLGPFSKPVRASFLISIQTEPEPTLDIADRASITSSTFSDNKLSDGDGLSKHSSANTRSSPVINDKSVIFQYQLEHLSPLDSDLRPLPFFNLLLLNL